ncbi:MAG: PilZ domain-containing protein, partial [Myxococcales bacterium]
SQVTLARLFRGEQLRAFAQEYLQSRRATSMGSELDRVIDAMAAWELAKTMRDGDPWRPGR